MIGHPDAVGAPLLSLLKELMQIPELSGFALGGGTRLALEFGHRTSVDIDLFAHEPFDSSLCRDALANRFTGVQVVNQTPGSVCAIVSGAKVDLLHHPYPLLEPVATVSGIRMLSLPDIAAMKMNAVTNRGSRKDFTDLLALHDHGVPLENALDRFCAKYGPAGRFLAVRSLMWFDDADAEPDLQFHGSWSWPTVRARMLELAGELARRG